MAAAPAAAHGPATARAAGFVPELVSTTIDPQLLAGAERLAVEYAAAQGWPDACAGRAIRVDVLANIDELYGRDITGYAVIGDDGGPLVCAMAIDLDSVTGQHFCQVYVHERLHLLRNDGWHDPRPMEPLSATGTYEPCWRLRDRDPHALEERVCFPGWARRSTVPIRWLYEDGYRRKARARFRRWARHHRGGARRARAAPTVCRWV